MFNLKKSKRQMLIYVTIVMWTGLGVLGTLCQTSYASMSVYFLSLTGFVGAYIWGESVRPATCTSILKRGRNSGREVMIYVCVLLWAAVGAFGIMRGSSLEELATYYSTLTPFVGAYILGTTYKPTKDVPAAQDASVPVPATGS